MQDKLWYFSTWDNNYQIKEATVEKETEKQFVVSYGSRYSGRSVIRKATMENTYQKYFLSKEQAEKACVQYLKERIFCCQTRIKNTKEEIEKYKAILKERFNIEVK